MSLILSGTDGLSDVDGTAATPAIRGTDANTGIFFPAADTIAFSEGGAEAMRIDSSGNVGIGTATPDIFSRGYGKIVGINDSGSSGAALEINSASSYPAVELGRGGVRKAGISAQSTVTEFYNLEAVPMTFTTNSSERMRIDSSGKVGIGTTSPSAPLQVQAITGGIAMRLQGRASPADGYSDISFYNNANTVSFASLGTSNSGMFFGTNTTIPLQFYINSAEVGRFDTSGNLFVGRTSDTDSAGLTLGGDGLIRCNRNGGTPMVVNRNTDDGTLISFRQAGAEEGTISVSGTTVTYGGGHLARFGQLPDGSQDPALLKGTVLTNLNEMCVWINKETGIPANNEQCNKVKISDVDGDANVAGVFVNWTYDEQHDTNDLYVAMTGDMIIRIAQGTTVQRGDLLMSAGNGTAKPQGDDIVRSKTVAKVTSTHVTCTYADGSYCVPCVLMAC